jgi:hypothetical protein
VAAYESSGASGFPGPQRRHHGGEGVDVVGIIEHDRGGLAAELEHRRCEVGRARLRDTVSAAPEKVTETLSAKGRPSS